MNEFLYEFMTLGSSGKWQFGHPVAAQRAARCLGTTVEELSRTIFTQHSQTSTNVARSSYKNVSPTDGSKNIISEEFTGLDALEGFVVGLYVEVFNLVASYINR
jgi:myosin-18